MTKQFGMLVKVDLRELWNGEASDFTPWLAQEENINYLGETIGIELEVQEQEQQVGLFRADILCKEVLTDHFDTRVQRCAVRPPQMRDDERGVDGHDDH